jgi:hypothetical protein
MVEGLPNKKISKGQKRAVEVITLRNPKTVETLIWDKLNHKIDNIMQSLQEVMDELCINN